MSGGSQKLFGDVSGGRLAEAQKFADQGQWGQAAQQYQLGGGQFGQPQMQAFSQQYGNANPFSQLGGALGMTQPGFMTGGPNNPAQGGSGYTPYLASPGPGGPMITADGPGSGMWGPPQAQPSLPPAQMRPITPTAPRLPMAPPAQAQPIPTPPPMAAPTPPSPGFMGHHNVSAGRLAEAQRLGKIAGVGGNMGLAKQQWELGGGKWSPDAHMFLDGRLQGGLLGGGTYGEQVIYN